MSSEMNSEAAARQTEKNREIRDQLTLIYASISGITISFYVTVLPILRENFHNLTEAQQFVVRNLFDYIGNSFNAYQFILPLIPLDLVFSTALYFARDEKKELFEFLNVLRKLTPIFVAAFFVVCNIDVETVQLLPWSDGTPQTEDMIAGFFVLISGILNLHYFQRVINEKIFLPEALVHKSDRLKNELQT